MANNVTSRLTIQGTEAQVKDVLDFIKGVDHNGKELLIDFNKIVPMPAELDIPQSSELLAGLAYAKYLVADDDTRKLMECEFTNDAKRISEMKKWESEDSRRFAEALSFGMLALSNIEKYGYENWYSWRYQYWGSARNAYEQEMIAYDIIQFQTAWCGVVPVIAKLAEKFPDVEFDYIYADEDLGYNIGSYHFHGDEVENHSPEEATAEAWELIFELDLAQPEYMVQKEDGSWEWKDEEDED